MKHLKALGHEFGLLIETLKMDNLGYTADVDETPPPKYSSRRVAIAPMVIIDSPDDEVDVQYNDADADDDNDNGNGNAGNHDLEHHQSATR